jgi:hypothetical protein
MQSTLEELVRYLEHSLGVTVSPRPWQNERLPHFLRESYELNEVEVLGTKCLLMVDTSPEELAPAALRKHVGLVQARWGGDVVYVRGSVTAYNRKRLVEHKVPFIVPGNQMYLPALAIDFREHFRRQQTRPARLSPSGQALLIHLLLRTGREVVTAQEAAGQLGYSAMTMTRAFDELETTQLARVSRRGKERCLRAAGAPQEVWAEAQNVLRSPVKKRLFIHGLEIARQWPRGGLTALAQYTMLASPARRTHSLGSKEWASLRGEQEVIPVPQQDPKGLEIEVWSYSPLLFAKGDVVDPLSLYLSLREDDDERVAASLEELMEELAW